MPETGVAVAVKKYLSFWIKSPSEARMFFGMSE